jgi:hypothetical protein
MRDFTTLALEAGIPEAVLAASLGTRALRRRCRAPLKKWAGLAGPARGLVSMQASAHRDHSDRTIMITGIGDVIA